MDESRPVRCDLTLDEASLLVDILKDYLESERDQDVVNTILARVQYAADQTVDTTNVRGPSGDTAEYEW